MAVVVAASDGDGDTGKRATVSASALAAALAARGPRAEVEAVEMADLATHAERKGQDREAGGGRGSVCVGASLEPTE